MKLADHVWQRNHKGKAHYFINGKSVCGKFFDEPLTNKDNGMFAHMDECSNCYVIKKMIANKEAALNLTQEFGEKKQ